MIIKNMDWNTIWKSESFYTDLYPTKNIVYFYKHHLSPLKKNIKILDCGCGNGRNFKFLIEKGFDVYGTDISPKIINENKKKFKRYKSKFKLGDIRSLNFQKNFFDVIISEASLYYQGIEDIKKTIEKFHYLLKPGGIIRVYTKSINDNFFKTFDKRKSTEYKVKKNHWEKGLTLSFLTFKDVKKIFKKFKELKIGIEEFNYIDQNKKHSFYIITAKK